MQEGEFQPSLQSTAPPSGAYSGPETYQWESIKTYDVEPQIPLGKLLVDGEGQLATATGHAYSPGIWEARCRVGYRLIAAGEMTYIDFRGNCAVIGGRIDIWVGGGSLTTHTHDEDRAFKPWYVQWFGYSHWNPPPLLDYKIQKTQDAMATVTGQPAGTELDWLVPYPLESSVLLYDPNSAVIDVFAEYASGPQQISCFFSLTFTGMWGDVALNGGWDDTLITPLTQGSSVLKTSFITAHMPADTGLALTSDSPISPPPGSAACGELRHTIWLDDQLGQRMPRVWVQERFASPLPPNFRTNNQMQRWITLQVPASSAGWFDLCDRFSYVWTDPPFTPPFQTWNLAQQYWAATKYTGLTDPGVFVGSWSITLDPGPPGVATHVKQ